MLQFCARYKWVVLAYGIGAAVMGCQNAPDRLEGKWQRSHDASDGSVVEIKRVDADQYEGRLLKVTGELNELQFEPNELKWKRIAPLSDHTYKGLDLTKATQKNGRVAFERYDAVLFILENDDILLVAHLPEGENDPDSQKWRKIK